MRKNLALLIAAPTIILLLVLGASFALGYMIDRSILDVVDRKAQAWVTARAPQLAEQISLGRQADPRFVPLDAGETSLARVRLFDLKGRELAGADTAGDAGHSVNGIAADVAASVRSSVSLQAVTSLSGDTRTFATAYAPIKDIDGSVVGVVETSFDRTDVLGALHAAAFMLSVTLSVVFATALSLLYVAFIRTRRKESRSRSQVDYLAKYDQLSGVLNRSGFTERATAVLNSKPADGAQYAVLYIDIDHFKQINDTLGHKAGDAFLRHVGTVLNSCCEPGDVAGRLGGDEFAVVLTCGQAAEVERRAMQLQSLVSQPLRADGLLINTTLSIGIDLCRRTQSSITDRLHRADLALYQAKLDGRNTHRLFTPELQRQIARRRDIESCVLTGIETGLFAVHFQPLLDEKTKACLGFEALLRLTTAAGESISPAEFIPIAETIGAINKLGAWVLAKAAETAATWPAPLFVAVNLSVRQFDNGDLTGIVEGVLAETGLEASRLELEVTESLLMQNTEIIGAQLQALRALGVSVAMDDFGTGYSSLGTLWKFGFDKLKIDRSFVSGLESGDERAMEILDTIIALGHRLNMVVTAEGVETPEQAELLAGLACDQLQGYLYGRPMPAADLPAALLRLALSSQKPNAPALSVPMKEPKPAAATHR